MLEQRVQWADMEGVQVCQSRQVQLADVEAGMPERRAWQTSIARWPQACLSKEHSRLLAITLSLDACPVGCAKNCAQNGSPGLQLALNWPSMLVTGA